MKGLHYKFRVFKEPQDVDDHPVRLMMAPVYRSHNGPLHLEEVEDFVFVLRPERDSHALQAMIAYAASCQEEKPELAQDILNHVDDLKGD